MALAGAGSLVIAAVLAFGAAASRWQSADALTNCSTGTAAHDGSELEVIGLINEYRASLGLSQLSASNGPLAQAAAWFSEDASANQTVSTISHGDSFGRQPYSRLPQCGYVGQWFGEVMGIGQRSPAAIVAAWKNSPGHDAILRNPLAKSIGVGHTGLVWVADLGSASEGGSTPQPPATNTPTPWNGGSGTPGNGGNPGNGGATAPAGGATESPVPGAAKTVLPSKPFAQSELPSNVPVKRAMMQMVASE